jgi:hypothetical protein
MKSLSNFRNDARNLTLAQLKARVSDPDLLGDQAK